MTSRPVPSLNDPERGVQEGDSTQEDRLLLSGGRDADLESSAAQRGYAHRDVPAVYSGDLSTNGQAETRATLVARPRFIQAHKAFEYSRLVLRRNAVTIIIDPEPDKAAAFIATDLDSMRGVSTGVCYQIDDESSQFNLVPADDSRHDGQ